MKPKGSLSEGVAGMVLVLKQRNGRLITMPWWKLLKPLRDKQHKGYVIDHLHQASLVFLPEVNAAETAEDHGNHHLNQGLPRLPATKGSANPRLSA